MWRLPFLLLLVLFAGCNHTPHRYDRGSLSETAKRLEAASLKERSDQVGSTINIVSEVILVPIGLENLGITLYETNRFIRREIAEPIDRARRFQIFSWKGAVEFDFDERLRWASFGVVLRF